MIWSQLRLSDHVSEVARHCLLPLASIERGTRGDIGRELIIGGRTDWRGSGRFSSRHVTEDTGARNHLVQI